MDCETDSSGKRKRYSLLKPIRDREGRLRFHENVVILKKVSNLGREMYLVRFDDGTTTFVFPDEIHE